MSVKSERHPADVGQKAPSVRAAMNQRSNVIVVPRMMPTLRRAERRSERH
jgi:hypothetical protein